VIGILLALFGIGLAVFGVLVLGRIVRSSLTPVAAPTPAAAVITEKVVTARRDLPVGSVLKVEDLELVEAPVELAAAGVLSDPQAAAGRMVKVPLVAGELVMSHHLADPTNIQHDLAFVLGDDQVLMAFAANDLLSGLNLLQRGDLVDVLVSINEPVPPEDVGLLSSSGEAQEPEERLFTFNALQRVEISAVVVEIIQDPRGTMTTGGTAPGNAVLGGAQATPQPTPTPAPSEVDAKGVLLALKPQDALVLKHLKDAGGMFDLVLRSPTSNQIHDLDPVMPEYLIDRYELEVKR
jgi:pilus assembly protein CpaB